MKLYDVEPSAQSLINDAAHVPPDKGDDKPLNTFGTREKKDFGNFSYE
jgi:hypothetical protein